MSRGVKFQVGGPRALFVLMICSFLWMINFMHRQVFSVVLEPMKRTLEFTDAEAGLLSSAMFIGMALFSIPAAYWSDRWSRKNAIGIMAIVWSVATLFTGLGRDFPELFAARFVAGVGIAGFSSAAMALISMSYEERVRARMLGVFNLFQVFGIAISLILGGYLSANFGGWATPFYFFAVPGIIAGILAFFMQDYDATGENEHSHNPNGVLDFYQSAKTLLSVPSLVWFYAGYTLVIVATLAVITWVPALIMRKFDVVEDVAGLIMAGTGIFTLPGVLLGGVFADRWQQKDKAGRMRFAAIMSLLSGISIVPAIVFLFILPGAGFWLIAGVAMAAIFFAAISAITPAVMAATQSVAPKRERGLVWGLGLFLVMAFGGAWAPSVTGSLSDLFGGGSRGLAFAILTMGLACLGGYVCFRQSARHYARDVERLQPPVTLSAPKIAIVGAGAIGSLLGAMLARNKYDVTLIGSQEQVQVIKENGLSVDGVRGAFSISLQVAQKLTFTPDILFLAVKTQDLEAACRQVQPYIGNHPVVLLQNGVRAAKIAASVLGSQNLLTAIVLLNARYVSPGQVTYVSEKPVLVGEVSRPNGERAGLVRDLLGQMAATKLAVDIPAKQWAKLFVNAMSNALDAMTGLSLGEYRRDPVLLGIGLRILRESLAVIEGGGIRLQSLPGLPLAFFKLLLKLPDALATRLLGRVLKAQKDPGILTSTLQSLRRGKRTEVEYLNGEIVALGRELNKATPYNARVVELIHTIEVTGKFFSVGELAALFEIQSAKGV